MAIAVAREPLSSEGFVAALKADSIPADVATFVWEEVQPYYFKPLTPIPADRLITDLKVDPDDLSDMVMNFGKRFSRVWSGKCEGSDDPSLAELAKGLLSSTEPA